MKPVRPYILQEEKSNDYHWFYTYVLISEKDGNFYTGSTNDLIKRIEKHKNGLVSSTKYRLPIKLVYFEACLNKPVRPLVSYGVKMMLFAEKGI